MEGKGLNVASAVGVELGDELVDSLRGGDLEYNLVSAPESEVGEVGVDLAVGAGAGYGDQGEGDGASVRITPCSRD